MTYSPPRVPGEPGAGYAGPASATGPDDSVRQRQGSVKRSIANAVGLGVLCGAFGGLCTALSDFGAQGLWLEQWADRAWLLIQLVGLQAPVGALLGGLLGGLLAASEPALQRWERPRWPRPALRAALLSLLCAPVLGLVAHLLFSGGSMSRLAGRPVLEVLSGAGLVGLSYGGLRGLQAGLRRVERGRGRARIATALALLAVGAALSKLDQRVLPGYYAYLHAALSMAALLTSALAAYVLLNGTQEPRRALARGAWPALAVAVAVLLATRHTLEDNQTVRVALLSPRASHSRSLLELAQPLFETSASASAKLRQATAQARRARALRAAQANAGAAPAYEGAHLLLITVDALRPDHLGHHGYARPTSPELDALARDSVVFERAYCQAPHSSYSLSALLTSEYLHETLDLGQPAPSATLATVLAGAGYHTAAFYTDGIFHTAGERLKPYEASAFGFAVREHQDRPAEEMTDRALEELDRIIGRGEPPTLLWVHYFDVHEPYQATRFGSSDRDRYDSEIRVVDSAVARLVREARARLAREVVVALTSDHGEEFREHGGVYHGSSLYDEQVRVPAMLNAPGLSAHRVSAPVESIDLAPTLLRMLGVTPPASMRGDDLRDLASGKEATGDPVFSAVIHKKMVVDWPYKLIADLRFGLFELYDLSRDPHERQNLANRDPERLAALRGQVYAWLDSLAQHGGPALTAEQQALEWGRLGDRRAVEPLSRLVLDATKPVAQRVEAARTLGRLADTQAGDDLTRALNDPERRVAAEAAIALGRMYDERARTALRALMTIDDADLRARAAVSLGRLRDRAAVPALIDALWTTREDYEREEAIRWLGRLRDARAIDPLLSMLPEIRTRYLVALAVGLIGDPRAFEPLSELLRHDDHPNVRDNAVRGLALLGDRRAVELILPLAVNDRGLENCSESLVRLDAIGGQRIGGCDVRAGLAGQSGLGQCQAAPELHDWNYLHRTFCMTEGGTAALPLQVPAAVAAAPLGAVAVLGVRRSDAPQEVELEVTLGGTRLEPMRVDANWSELRWTLPPGALRSGALTAQVTSSNPQARFALDHLLLLPLGSELAAAP
jgi:arylsulfatase A-like enzyme